MEKALQCASDRDRYALIEEVLHGAVAGTPDVVLMMRDPFANYVCKALFDLSTETQRERIAEQVRPHYKHLKTQTCAKNVVAKLRTYLGP